MMSSHTQRELNAAAWPILVEAAKNNDYMTYDDLAQAINKKIGTTYTSRHIGQNALDRIETYCLKHDWPDLTALVISKSKELPGKDFFRRNNLNYDGVSEATLRNYWITIRNAVYAFTWQLNAPNDL